MSNQGRLKARSRRPTLVYAVSLGCPKNRVDTEVMLGALLSSGFALCSDLGEADIVLVNTCAFLQEARQESLNTLKEVACKKRPGAKIIAAGCMGEAFRDEIVAEIPEAIIVGARDPFELPRLLRQTPGYFGQAVPARLLTTEPGTAYLKIADGCSRRCSFCIIPRIRGKQKSRLPDEIVAEAKMLAAHGVREVVLVAQDLTHYGYDLPGRPDIAELVNRIASEVPDLHWIRLMYLFPRDIPTRLTEVIRTRKNVLPYLDLPVQHADDRVLKAMRRGTTRKALEQMIRWLREEVPGVVLRTTYLVGFPGETEEAFENLLDFALKTKFEMAGVFTFSAEPGSLAARLPNQIPRPLAKEREERLCALLGEVAAHLRQQLLGQVHEAIVTSLGQHEEALGRLWFQAPEVDGIVKIRKCREKPGRFVRVRITGVKGNDFEAEAAA